MEKLLLALILIILVAFSGCITSEDADTTPVSISIDSYSQDGLVDEDGTANVKFKLSAVEGKGETYVAILVPTAFSVEGNIRDNNYERFGLTKLDGDTYEVFMVANDAFSYEGTAAQEYTAKISVDSDQLASKDRRNTALQVYWYDSACGNEVDLDCYVLLDESRKSVTLGK
ncbi:MAG: hypothetical protein ABIG20_00755 [archaeon]